MSARPLTVRQEQLWRFIQSCERSPTYDEMAAGIGYSVRGGAIVGMVEALVVKGYARRLPGRHRTIIAVDPNLALAHFSTDELTAELMRRLAA